MDGAGAEIAVDFVLPAEGLEGGNAVVDEGLPAFGGVAAAMDVDHAAARVAAVGDAHLDEAVLAESAKGEGFGLAVAADEGGVLHADELAFVVGGNGDAIVVEVHDESVHFRHAAEIVGEVEAAEAEDGGGGALEDDGLGGGGDHGGAGAGDGFGDLADRGAGGGNVGAGAGSERRLGGGGEAGGNVGGLADRGLGHAEAGLGRWGGFGGDDGSGAEADAADLAGAAVDVPGAAFAEDDGGFWRQVGRDVGLESALFAENEGLAGGVPLAAADAGEEAEDGGDLGGRNRAAGFGAGAEELGEDAVGFGAGLVE